MCIYCSGSASGRFLRSAIATLFSYTIPSHPLIPGLTLSFLSSPSVTFDCRVVDFVLLHFYFVFNFFEANLINNPFTIRNTHSNRIFPTAVDQISSHKSQGNFPASTFELRLNFCVDPTRGKVIGPNLIRDLIQK